MRAPSRLSVAVLLLVATASVAGAEPLREPLDRTAQKHLRKIILEGSAKLSRTVAEGALREGGGDAAAIRKRAAANFRATLTWMLANAHELPLDPETAREINRRLREGIEGERFYNVDNFGSRHAELPAWSKVLTPKALASGERDPVELAARIHTEAQGYYEDFWDANGRTSRLMADLALIKQGRAPVAYPAQKEYFKRGSPDRQGPGGWSWVNDHFKRYQRAGERRLSALRRAERARATRAPGRRR